MDYLQEAKDFCEYACERMDQGKYDRSVMDRELAKTYALIALVDRLDAMTTDGADGMKALNCVNFIADAPQQ